MYRQNLGYHDMCVCVCVCVGGGQYVYLIHFFRLITYQLLVAILHTS